MVAARFWFLESALASAHFLANKRAGYGFGAIRNGSVHIRRSANLSPRLILASLP